ncbi:Ig-like domain-containing protein [Paenibacillus sp. NPDC058071]|uniref:Ig-like domain-containing protein n=1 Tax=Paenibacillus sp. NPDC058071 TaxID=3346326 RepID=UPI0036DB767C
MNRYRKRLSLTVAIVIALQLVLPNWLSFTAPVEAAATGPVLQSTSPQDDFTGVQLNAPLTLTFDEPVARGTGSAAFTIYNYTQNKVFESYNVATDSRISIDASGRTVTVRPSAAFALNTDYYVLIDPGAFINQSNGANYVGIANASQWNFKTIEQVDVNRPQLLGINPAHNTTGVPITSAITLVFDKPVYVAGGDIVLTNSTPSDDRKISVTSSQVTGSGTNTITITPQAAMLPNSTYTISIPSGAFQDYSGNSYQGTYWRFVTAAAPVNVTGFEPIDNATSVKVNASLVVAFDKDVAASANKYIHLVRAYDNYDERILATDTSRVSITGSVVTITTSKKLPLTQYYVLIDPGAFVDKTTGEWFQGISNASVWDFTTDPGDAKDAPLATAVYPTNGVVVGTLTSNLEIAFNKPVYPDQGNIEIRNVVNNVLFRSIPVTSTNVTGGGTNKITINPNKALNSFDTDKSFVNNSQYYVVIGNRAFRDAANNYYGGMAANQWQFRVAQDTVKPLLEVISPQNNSTNVLPNSTFYALFNKPVMAGSGEIWIRPINSQTARPVKANFYVNPDNSKQIIITQPSGTVLEGGVNYYIEIGSNAVVDYAGLAYEGIKNQYQWTFKTIGNDTTPPAVTKLEYSGNIITLTFNEDLGYSIPEVSNFYITVNDLMRRVTSVAVAYNTVKLTLASEIINGQSVKLSYSKPLNGGGIKDLIGNQALNIATQDVVPLESGSAATITSGSVNGNVVTLNFSRALAAANSRAHTQFGISINGSWYEPSSIYVSGSTVQLTVNYTFNGQQTVYVSYTPGSLPIKDSNGINVASFSSYRITGGPDYTTPSLISAISNGSTITIRYNKWLSGSSIPSVNDFTVSVNSNLRSVTQVRISGETVVLSLSSSVNTNDSVYVTYNPGTYRIKDEAGNQAPSFTGVYAPVGNTSGLLAAVVAKGSTVTLTFNETLNISYVPIASQFLIQSNGTTYTVSKIEINGSTVTLTLSSSLTSGSAVTFSYNGSSTNGLRTVSGKTVENIMNFSASNQTSSLDTIPGGFVQVTGGGIGIDPSTVIRTTGTSPAGFNATKYTVQAEKITLGFQALRTTSSSVARLVIQVPSSENAAIVAVPIAALQSAMYYSEKGIFAVQYNGVSYEIPLASLNYSQILNSVGSYGVGSDLLIEIDKGNNNLTSSLTSAINSNSRATILSTPANFVLSATNGSAKQPVTAFYSHVTKTFQVTSSVTVKSSTVVWYDPAVQGISYVPTVFQVSGSDTIASFKRKGNGVYALVQGSFNYNDINRHWAGETILLLANKFIVEGRSSGGFEPEKPITRGEFATYIAKGLGLPGNDAAAAKYRDVYSGTKMAAYIGAASDAGIVMGHPDGTFKPNSPITRQEMAVMMTRAAKVADVSVSLPSSTASYLSKFSDRNKIASWAQTDVAKAVYTGVITGKTTTTFSPTTNATRAEATVMIKRLLEYVKFL